jgi:hypothetical protein
LQPVADSGQDRLRFIEPTFANFQTWHSPDLLAVLAKPGEANALASRSSDSKCRFFRLLSVASA